LCHEFYQFLLCQGILLGVSAGLIFAPALSVVGHYFFQKRAMAMSLASTGSPIGGIIYPVILNSLIPSIGFGWAQRVCGFLSLFLLGTAAFIIRPTGMKRKGRFILLEAFKNPACSFQVAALFMVVLGIWIPYFYLAEYGLAHVAHTADHPSKIGTYVGQSTFVVGFAGLAGTPITGALINYYHGYTQGIAFNACVIMAGAILITAARYHFACDKLIA
ncbi:hypothetical protein M8818_006980, partial [Zalaria obscura]